MFAYTILLVACVVAGTAATKSHGGIIQRSIALQPTSLLARNTIQNYRVTYPYAGATRSVMPAPKVRSYNSAIDTSNLLQSDATSGLFSNQAVIGYQAPALVAPSTLGAIISPTTFGTSGISTYNVGLGNSATYDSAGSLGATYLLNSPGISFNSPSLRFPTAKKAAIGAGSY